MEASPFVQIFMSVGIPAAAHILNFVVLTAAVSVYNSAIYSNSRMLYGLAAKNEAPKFLGKLSSRGVPVRGILVSSGITLVCVALNYFFPGKIFMLLMSIATIAATISWLTIVITHLKFRAHCLATGKATKFKSPLYPLVNYLCIAFLLSIWGLMTQIEGMDLAVYILPAWLLCLWIGFKYQNK